MWNRWRGWRSARTCSAPFFVCWRCGRTSVTWRVSNVKVRIPNTPLDGGCFCFALALMAKPMAVTLPLCCCCWISGRWSGCGDWIGRRGGGWLVEKWPLLALSAVWCGITVWAQGVGQAVASAAELPLSERINHALISYLDYVRVLVFPWHLAAYYPYQHHEPVIWGVAAGAALALMTWLVLAGARRRPYLAVGWLWFLGMLVPVIGLVQVGGQGWADRYVYLPSIGFFVIVVWGGAEWAARHPAVKLLVPVVGRGAGGSDYRELQYWKDTRDAFWAGHGGDGQQLPGNDAGGEHGGGQGQAGGRDPALPPGAGLQTRITRKRIFFSAARWNGRGRRRQRCRNTARRCG